jgi:anti-anti-sigma factor
MSSFHYGNPALECGDAQVRRQCRQLATVLTVTGSIDASNADILIAQATKCVIPEKPVIVDLSGISTFDASGIAVLDAIDAASRALNEQFLLVANASVIRTLKLCGAEDAFEIAASVPDAIQTVSDVAGERRRLLPILRKSA